MCWLISMQTISMQAALDLKHALCFVPQGTSAVIAHLQEGYIKSKKVFKKLAAVMLGVEYPRETPD